MDKKEDLTIKGRVKITKTNTKTGEKKVSTYKNLITNKGLQLIANALTDDVSFIEGITYLALGSGTTEAAATDTTLETETFRKLLTSRARSGQDVEITVFLTTEEANATHNELGLFGNGADGDPDTGDLFNRLILSGEEKTAAETWTIEITIQIRYSAT